MNQTKPVHSATRIVIDEPSLRYGFIAVPNYLFAFKRRSHGAKLTFILLLKYAWQQTQCFPGVVRLAAELEVERKSVIRYTQELMSRGLVAIERRGRGRTNVYHLCRFVEPEVLQSSPIIEARCAGAFLSAGELSDGKSRSPIHSTSRSPIHGTPIIHSRRRPRILYSVSPNAFEKNETKEVGRVEYLVGEILKVCTDFQSEPFYKRVAAQFDDSLIFRFLSEIRHDNSIRNRGAIFTSKVKAWRARHQPNHAT